MGSSSSKKEDTQKSDSKFLDLSQFQNNIEIPLSLILLSLIKIEEIRSYLQENQEKIGNNKNLILLNILLGLNKSEKLMDNYVILFKKAFPKIAEYSKGISLFDKCLQQMNKEMKIIEINENEDNCWLIKLFYFRINLVCNKCGNKAIDDYSLLFDSNFFLKDGFSCELFCKQCKAMCKQSLIRTENPKIIIAVNINLKENRYSEYEIKNYLKLLYINQEGLAFKSYENVYKYNMKKKHYNRIIWRDFENEFDKQNVTFYKNENNFKEENMDKINSFYKNKGYEKAIINYLNLKRKKQIEFKMYLVNKEFFDNLLMICEINLNKELELNKIKTSIESNQIEIMNMNKLIIYDEPYKILGDVDLVTEEILINLGYKNEYNGKSVKIEEIVKGQIYRILFHDNSVLKLVFQNNEQILSFSGVCSYNKSIKANTNSNLINKNHNDDASHVKNEPKPTDTKNGDEKMMKEKLFIFYNNICTLYNVIFNINNIINNHIVDEKNFEDYLIISKKLFNRITKIFESDEVYEDDNKVLNNKPNIPDINSLDSSTIQKMFDNYVRRKKKLKNDENLFKIDYECTKIDKEEIAYPKDFLIIKEKTLNNLLINMHITNEHISKNKYRMQIGEKYIFVMDNLNSKNIFVCKNDNGIIFNTQLILYFSTESSIIFPKEVRNYIKGKSLENYLSERNIDLGKRVQKIINKEKEEIGQLIIIAKYNPYIKSIFTVLSNFPNFQSCFKNTINHKNYICNFLANFIYINDKNLIETSKIISGIENKLKALSNYKLKLDNFKELIKLILNTLDDELNTKNKNMNINIEDYDQSFVFNKFKQAIDHNNDSIIYKLFCGFKKITSNYQFCKIEKYKFKPFKYLHLKIEKNVPTDINSLIMAYENNVKNIKGECNYCSRKEEDIIRKKEISKFPEILIIILDNKDDVKINCDLDLKIKNDNFSLINSITKSEIKEDFNILYKEGSKYLFFDGNETKEVNNEINNLIQNPYVLFYQKQNLENQIKPVKDNLANNSPDFVNVNFQMKENNINNQNGNNILNPMINKAENFMKEDNNQNQNNMINIFNNNMNNNANNNQINIMNNMNNNNNINNNMIPSNNSQQNNMMNINNNNHHNIKKSWNPLNNNNMNIQNNIHNNNLQNNIIQPNNMNFNNMGQMKPRNISLSVNQKNLMFNNKLNQNNNQMNLLNNNIQNPNQIGNQNNQFNNQNMFINANNMNNQFINQMNNNMMNQNNMNIQNGINIFNNNNPQMMNNIILNNNQMNMNNNNQIMNQNNLMNMNNNNQIMNQNNPMNMNNNHFMNQNNPMNMNNNQFMNQNNQISMNNNNQIMNQNNQMNMNNNHFMNQNNNQMNMNNNNQMINQNNNQMNMNNNNQMINQNNNQMNMNNNNQFANNYGNMNGNNFIQIQNNLQNMSQNNNNMPIINNQEMQNNQNLDNNNQNVEDNKNISLNPKDEITLYFNFKNDKQIYIDVNKNLKFSEVVNQLKEKYVWLNDIKIVSFIFEGKQINFNKSCEENGIDDASKIYIIEE